MNKVKEKPERLDKILSSCGALTRSEARRAISQGRLTVDGVPARSCETKITRTAQVCLDGKLIDISEFVYIMLNKPQGYVCSTDDGDGPTVFELIKKEDMRPGLFPAGRLDKNTEGLVIITNDGAAAHRWLSPRSHVEKEYYFCCRPPVDKEKMSRLLEGVDIGDGRDARCAAVSADDGGGCGTITLTEGRFHQIKRMFKAVGSEITFLKRISFGGVKLDEALERGGYRYLSDEEKNALKV